MNKFDPIDTDLDEYYTKNDCNNSGKITQDNVLHLLMDKYITSSSNKLTHLGGKVKEIIRKINSIDITDNNKSRIEHLIDKFHELETDDSLLHYMVFTENYEFVKYLLVNKMNPNVCDKDGQTPLFRTIYTKNMKIADVLINNGAHINVCDRDGNTVLHLAVLIKNMELIKLLLNNKVQCDILNNFGLKPIELCRIVNGNDTTYDTEILKLFGNKF